MQGCFPHPHAGPQYQDEGRNQKKIHLAFYHIEKKKSAKYGKVLKEERGKREEVAREKKAELEKKNKEKKDRLFWKQTRI